MASQILAEHSAFADVEKTVSQELTVGVRDGLTLASFSAAKGKREALVAAIQDKYGLTLPSTPVRVEGNGHCHPVERPRSMDRHCRARRTDVTWSAS